MTGIQTNRANIMNIEKLEKLKAFADSLPPESYSYITPDNLRNLVNLALEAARHRARIGMDQGFEIVEALAPPIPNNVTHLRRSGDLKVDGELMPEFKEPK